MTWCDSLKHTRKIFCFEVVFSWRISKIIPHQIHTVSVFLNLPRAAHAGNGFSQLPSVSQVAVPPPTYPVSQSTDADPPYRVEPDNTPLVIVSVPQSEISS